MPELSQHCLPQLVDAGTMLTLNSDDPAYFGGYVDDNFQAVRRELGVDDSTLREFAANSFRASLLDEADRARLLSEIPGFSTDHG